MSGLTGIGVIDLGIARVAGFRLRDGGDAAKRRLMSVLAQRDLSVER
jgi:hypothetical protein